MNVLRFLTIVTCFAASSLATASDGLLVLKSPYSAKETMNRFEDLVKQRGLNVFARIDHAAGAAKVGKTLRPTEVIIFGNPQGGTPFMECAQTVGIDLPLKALVWQDSTSQVWLGYNDPDFLGKRHGVSQCASPTYARRSLASLAPLWPANEMTPDPPFNSDAPRAARGLTERVYRAWHRASRVKVPTPGLSGAEG